MMLGRRPVRFSCASVAETYSKQAKTNNPARMDLLIELLPFSPPSSETGTLSNVYAGFFECTIQGTNRRRRLPLRWGFRAR